MKRPHSSPLGTLAVIGVILFIVTNWWTTWTGQSAPDALDETVPAVTKQEAAAKAETFVAKLAGKPARHTSVVYQADKLLSGYVQKDHWTADYKARYTERVPIDFYRVELVSDEGAEYYADVHMMSGTVIGWGKRSKERAPGVEEGRAAAEAYLREAGYRVEEYTLLPRDRKAPQQFVFEHRTETLGDAKLQAVVDVRKGEVTAFRSQFRIPDAHLDWVAKQDNASSEMTRWNLILSALMGVAAVIIAIVNRKRIAFARGAVLCSMFILLYWVNNVNMFPAFKTLEAEGYDPFLSGEAAVVSVFIMNAVVVVMGLVAYFSLAAGEPMWRDWGKSVWPRWRDASFGRETLHGMGRGYLLACLMLGVQSLLFFTAERKFGMWAVSDPSGSLYNQFKPWLFPLMAWTAAISEEAIYRFFGIALFKKLLRSTFLAVLVPSMIWAFSHTQYPIYPVYTRFVEVSVLGLVFGYAFLKFGFITALFAHAIMDSLLMSFSLMSMGGAFHFSIGLFYIVLPALIAVALSRLHDRYRRRRPPDVVTQL